MAAKRKAVRSKARKSVTRAKAAKKSTVRAGRRAPGKLTLALYPKLTWTSIDIE